MSVRWLITPSKRGRMSCSRRKKGMSSIGQQLIKASLEFTTTADCPPTKAIKASSRHYDLAGGCRQARRSRTPRRSRVRSDGWQKLPERKSRCRIAQEGQLGRSNQRDSPAWPLVRETTLSGPYLDSATVREISVGSPTGPARNVQHTFNSLIYNSRRKKKIPSERAEEGEDGDGQRGRSKAKQNAKGAIEMKNGKREEKGRRLDKAGSVVSS